ncbi:LCP family protein [Evansella tamaricis]|uniref:Regulatory protein MsrR n=1 Tax=Evansella tamaricis TaxID=2069301 RepID=A0ABS6JHX0_9BACI|nr:LCP family protein [Evansella tamaricis]MBU9713260.1 LCP family protein [Evansella tamaricis]
MKKTTTVTVLRWKLILLIFLLLILVLLLTTAWVKNEYSKAREDSLRDIQNRNGVLPADEEIQFHPPEVELDFINILLLGVDAENDGVTRTDTIMLGQYHPKEGSVRLVSLMRDSYVSIPGYRDNKLNASYALGGMELLRKTIKENFQVDVHYYAQVDFNSFIRIVDIMAPNGLEVDVENRMYYRNNSGSYIIDFARGTHILDGEDALDYARFRSDSQNDFGRVKRQQELLSLLKDEVLSLSGIQRIPQLLGSIEPYIQTNLSSQEMISYGRSFLVNNIEDIETMTVPVEGGFYDEYYNHAGAVLQLDIEKNREALHEFLKIKNEE